MKKAVRSGVHGYLMPKKELDDKLRERFPILKNKQINHMCAYNGDVVGIDFGDSSREKIEEGVLFEDKSKREGGFQLVVDMGIIRKMLGIKKNLNTINLKFRHEGSKFDGDFPEMTTDEDRLFYFLSNEKISGDETERYEIIEEEK